MNTHQHLNTCVSLQLMKKKFLSKIVKECDRVMATGTKIHTVDLLLKFVMSDSQERICPIDVY